MASYVRHIVIEREHVRVCMASQVRHVLADVSVIDNVMESVERD
jgi:hypothetical protein